MKQHFEARLPSISCDESFVFRYHQANTSIVVKAPGANHNARWMAKALYTLKIALLRNQLQNVYSEKELENTHNLEIFLVVFYTKQWLTSANTRDASSNDLELLRKLDENRRLYSKKSKGLPSFTCEKSPGKI